MSERTHKCSNGHGPVLWRSTSNRCWVCGKFARRGKSEFNTSNGTIGMTIKELLS